MDDIDTELVKENALPVIGIFAVVGVGLGTTGYLGLSIATDELMEGSGDAFGGLFVMLTFLQSALVSFLLGPTVAAVTGVISVRALEDNRTAIATNTVGAFVGFLLMTGIAVIIMSFGFPNMDGASFPISASEIPMFVLAAIPTAIVGAAAAAIAASAMD